MNIVITGASRGLGKAIAMAFAEDGQPHNLFLCAKTRATLEQAGDELKKKFPKINVYTQACDVTNKNELRDFAGMITTACGKADILVNNAGIYLPGSAYGEADGALESLVEVNLYSAYHLTRLLLPGMIKAKSGHIFNMCSIASLNAYPNGGAYGISKFALYGFSKNLREEMKPHNIKVTHVLPGAALTDSWKGVDPERIMEAADIAKMIHAAAHLSPQACVEEIILRPQLGDL
jgi:NADP-dependent 3-hydroxy acid dehydrogenase YdfG